MRARAVWLVAGLVALGFLIGLVSPHPSPGPGLGTDEAMWWLPADADLSRFEQTDMNTALGLRWQGMPDASSDAETDGEGPNAVPAHEWRLVGIVSDSRRMALIQPAGAGDIQRLGVDDALPDGARVTSIGVDHIDYRRDGCVIRRRLHHRHSQEQPVDDTPCGDDFNQAIDLTGTTE